MKNGKVYLVGAGPGDIGLITVKAIETIKRADVIVYDELANSGFLNHAAGNAEMVYVGKKAGDHAMAQEDIEKLLVSKAREGKNVCRLKGGDPCLFGRGGEEAMSLFNAGVEFEIVPGITSAISVPAYAGIPVTQRGYTSGVAIFTGHEDPLKEESDLNWEAMASLGTTLVFLMGMTNLPTICAKLIENGMESSTPAAIIHKGTTNAQRYAAGTLETIVKVVEKAGLVAPSIIVVGKVVPLRESIKWFEKRPLFGKKIIVTRSRAQASNLVAMLTDLGAEVIEYPTIEIKPNESAFPMLDKAIASISKYDWLIFTSVNGVDAFMERMRGLKCDARSLSGVNICSIGPATRDRLRHYFLEVDLMPERFVAESILEAFGGQVNGKRILLPRADIARDALPNGLREAGAELDVIDVYKTAKPEVDSSGLIEMIEGAHLVTFSSSSTAENFAALLGDKLDDIKNKVNAASIGPVTTESVKKAGFNLVCEAAEYTIPGLVEAVLKYFG